MNTTKILICNNCSYKQKVERWCCGRCGIRFSQYLNDIPKIHREVVRAKHKECHKSITTERTLRSKIKGCRNYQIV